MGFFSFVQEIAMDLGTANTIIISDDKIVVDEPSVVALDRRTDKMIAVGSKAKMMYEKTHDNIRTIRPLRDGVIADFTACEQMMRGLIKMVHTGSRLFSPSLRMVIGVPSGSTEVELRAVRDSAEHANGRDVYLIFEPMAAAIGIGIGLMNVVGECIGAGRKDEAIYYTKKMCLVSEVVIIISCLLVFALTKPIIHLGGMSAESGAMCFFMVTWITIIKPIVWVPAFIPAYSMRAAGDVKFSMILSCTTMWLCRVTLCVVLCRVFGFGPIAVWIGMFSDWTLRGIFYTLRFHGRKWLNHKVIE